MFAGGLREMEQEEVHIQGVSYNAMCQILNFIYTSELELGLSNVQEILTAACQLQVRELAVLKGLLGKEHGKAQSSFMAGSVGGGLVRGASPPSSVDLWWWQPMQNPITAHAGNGGKLSWSHCPRWSITGPHLGLAAAPALSYHSCLPYILASMSSRAADWSWLCCSVKHHHCPDGDWIAAYPFELIN